LAWFKRRRFEVTVQTLRGRVKTLSQIIGYFIITKKQLDKVVRRHNSHDRNAMRRMEFNFIKISCVIYKADSTPSLRETLLVARSLQVLPGIEPCRFLGMVHKESSPFGRCLPIGTHFAVGTARSRG
jgi:hypothetical protein